MKLKHGCSKQLGHVAHSTRPNGLWSAVYDARSEIGGCQKCIVWARGAMAQFPWFQGCMRVGHELSVLIVHSIRPKAQTLKWSFKEGGVNLSMFIPHVQKLMPTFIIPPSENKLRRARIRHLQRRRFKSQNPHVKPFISNSPYPIQP